MSVTPSRSVPVLAHPATEAYTKFFFFLSVVDLRLGDLVDDRRLVAVVCVGALAGSCGAAAGRVQALDGGALLAFGEGCNLLRVLEGSLCGWVSVVLGR